MIFMKTAMTKIKNIYIKYGGVRFKNMVFFVCDPKLKIVYISFLRKEGDLQVIVF